MRTIFEICKQKLSAKNEKQLYVVALIQRSPDTLNETLPFSYRGLSLWRIDLLAGACWLSRWSALVGIGYSF